MNLIKTLVIGVLILVLQAENPPLRNYKINGHAQGTSYNISYYATDSLITKTQIDSILNVIDLSMSLYKENSTITKFNKAQKSVQIDQHFVHVLKKAIVINKETKGVFDVTIAPLVQYWGFGPKPADSIQQPVSEILKNVGMDKLGLNGNILQKLTPNVTIDLNGIAQGYSVDVLADFFEERNISAYVVELGGEIRAKGPKPDGTLMRIGIEGPSENDLSEPGIKHIIQFKTGAITTSGNYRKFLTKGDKKISHLIDPKTGYPFQNEMISVTVYAKKAIDADGYDNTLMGMGVKNALKFIARKRDLEAYIIYRNQDGKVVDTLTAGFKKMIVK
ncbi:MAG: FAD:protein FMN transferase [Flavobacterium sp.]|nr:MAG: FAD:protein FMN transferase [Flavobacterium sp.]